MFSRLLVASDLSPAADRVVAQAAALHRLGAREAVLVHFLETPGWHVPEMAEAKADVEAKLESQRRRLVAAGLETTLHVTGGLPELEINRTATRLGAKLVVLGSHGHNFLSELVLGGTASAAIHQSVLPVLLVRVAEVGDPELAADLASPLFRHVLFPTDFSDNAEHAFAYVREIALRTACPATLLHVQDRLRLEVHLSERLVEFNRIDRARLDRLKDALAEVSAGAVDVQLPYGSPFREILRCVEEKTVSLVVMGSQGRGFLGESFLGSVSHKVARHARSHVLLVPPTGEAK